MDIAQDDDDEYTDIREQIFHNTVREQIVRIQFSLFFFFDVSHTHFDLMMV